MAMACRDMVMRDATLLVQPPPTTAALDGSQGLSKSSRRGSRLKEVEDFQARLLDSLG